MKSPSLVDPPEMTAPRLVVTAFRALSPEQQEEALEQICRARVVAERNAAVEVRELIYSLRVARNQLRHFPTVTEYRRLRKTMASLGVHIVPVAQLTQYFGSWSKAEAALEQVERIPVPM